MGLWMGPACGHDHGAAVHPTAVSDNTIDKVIRDLYNGRIDDSILPGELYQSLSDDLTAGVNQVNWDIDFNTPDHLMLASLRANVHAFSAAKGYAQMVEMRGFLTDDDGKLRSFPAFRQDARKIHTRHESWLESEFNNAVATSQMAAQWTRIQEDIDSFPFLIYTTAGDDRVRASHQALDGIKRPVNDDFWKTNYPPNQWGCRCDVRQDGSTAGATDPAIANELGNMADKGKMFSNNAGLTGIIYRNDHPYFQSAPRKVQELDAITNYGLRKLSTIYANPSKLKKIKKFDSRDDFNEWWDDQVGRSPTDIDGSFKVSHTPTDKVINVPATIRSKFLKSGKWEDGRAIIETIETPDEFYATAKGTAYDYAFVKYYGDKVRVVTAVTDKKHNKIKVKDMVVSDGKDGTKAAGLRKGILEHKR